MDPVLHLICLLCESCRPEKHAVITTRCCNICFCSALRKCLAIRTLKGVWMKLLLLMIKSFQLVLVSGCHNGKVIHSLAMSKELKSKGTCVVACKKVMFFSGAIKDRIMFLIICACEQTLWHLWKSTCCSGTKRLICSALQKYLLWTFSHCGT